MRRFIPYLDSLLLGAIFGMIFIATVHSSSNLHGVMITCQTYGAHHQEANLLIAGRAMHLIQRPAEFCGQTLEQGYSFSSLVIAISVSSVSSAKLRPACSIRR